MTCSDGRFCNGEERWAGGHCQPALHPCDDGVKCTRDTCDEASGACGHQPGPGCAICNGACTPDCTGRACGDDGCGGSCGSCGAAQACASALGTCNAVNQPGTCENPIPLLAQGEPLLGFHTLQGDSTNGLNEVIPTCNSTSTAPEMIYSFTITQPTGIDARSHDYDTVLHLRKGSCLDDAATAGCSDDSAPPGDFGSRVIGLLSPGTYFLIVDGFDQTQFGPYTLSVHFADNCVPHCDGRYCGGSDGCGGDCGTCAAGTHCVDFHCLPDPCTPDCAGRNCGDDGCGGSCGACGNGDLCVRATGNCQHFDTCNHDLPTCAGCGKDEFCGTDCACHKVRGAMPDLVVNQGRLASEIKFDTINVDPTSCSVVEQCVDGLGDRRVLRFAVEAVNQGQADLSVPPTGSRPDLFQFSPCHGHYHFTGFARYALLDENGNEIVQGHKQAYCMEDTVQVEQGPNVSCSKLVGRPAGDRAVRRVHRQ